jgi:hypothetical protein
VCVCVCVRARAIACVHCVCERVCVCVCVCVCSHAHMLDVKEKNPVLLVCPSGDNGVGTSERVCACKRTASAQGVFEVAGKVCAHKPWVVFS